MVRNACRLILVLILFPFSGKAYTPMPGPDATEIRISAAMREFQDRFPMMAWIYADTERVRKGFFNATVDENDLENDSWSSDEIFRAGSLGKPFIAMGIFRLERDSLLRTSDKITDYIPEFESRGGIRIIDLLTHRSGLDDIHYREYYQEDPPLSLEAALLKHRSDLVSYNAPGKYATYSNVNYALLALIIESVTGQDYDMWLRKNVLLPLGMQHSGFELKKTHPEIFGDEGEKEYLYNPSVGFFTSAGDMTNFLYYLVFREPVSGDSLFGDWIGPIISWEGEKANIEAYFPGLKRTWLNGNAVFGHTGFIEGWTAMFEYFPAQKKAIGLLYQSEIDGPWQAWPGLTALQSEIFRGFEKENLADLPVSEYPMEGYYVPWHPRMQLFKFYDDLAGGYRIRLENGKVFLHGAGDVDLLLKRMDEGTWYIDKNPDIRLSFESSSGRWVARMNGTVHVCQGMSEYYWRHAAALLVEIISIIAVLVLAATVYFRLKAGKPSGAVLSNAFLTAAPFPLALLAFRLWTHASYETLAGINFTTLYIFTVSILLPLLCLGSFILTFRMFLKSESLAWKGWFSLALHANLMLVLYLASYDLIGLRLWAW